MLPGDRGDVHDLAGELALVRSPDEVDEHPDGDGLPGRGDSRPRGDLAGVQDDGAEDSLRPDHDGFRMPVLIGEALVVIGAMITVRRCWLSSSGDTTRQGRVF